MKERKEKKDGDRREESPERNVKEGTEARENSDEASLLSEKSAEEEG